MPTQELAPVLERIDCGSGHHYGICPKCRRGHGHKIDLNPQTPTINTMSFLQVSPATEQSAHAAALDRALRSVPTAKEYATKLQAAHAAAVQRSNAICARERGVISIYALGEVISEIEADQIHHGSNGEIGESIALNRVINRLKQLLPIP
jgi:hypothetical protein